MTTESTASTAFATRHAEYGERWGEGAARCFSIETDFLDDSQGLRLMPVPDSFFCPISAAIMNDPVATVDGCSYERDYIERWFRERRQFRQPITSPTTGLQLQSTTLMPLVALQRAIEAYLLHRPELKRDHLAGRSFEEAAQALQIDLLDKQAVNASVHDEVLRLRESNRALKRALRETEAACKKVMKELEQTRIRVRELEDLETPPAAKESALATNAGSIYCASDKTDRDASEKQHSSSKMEARAGVPTSPQVSAPLSGSKTQEDKAKMESKRPKGGKLEVAVDVKASNQASLRANGCVQQFLQGGLLVALLVICFLVLRISPGLKAPLDAGGLQWKHGRGNLPISRQVEQLLSGSAEERMAAALALQKIAAEGEESQAAVREAGAVQPLVRLLEDNGIRLQEAGASALATLASSSAKSQVAIARAGAISPLVQLLKAGDINVAPKAAACALRHLAAGNEKNQVAIVRSGAISPLVEIMRSDAAGARFEAAMALNQLAGEGREESRYGKQVAIAQAGAILPLVRLVRDEEPGARQAAAGTLRLLATNHADNQVAIAQAGAIGPLVDLLGDAEPGARKEAAAALDHLAVFEVEANFGNQVAIGQAGAIPALSKLLQDGVPEVAFAAAGALRSLATGNADNLERIIQAGSIPALVAMIKVDRVLVPAVSLLRNLATSSTSSQAAAVQAGVVGPLVDLLKHEAPQIRGEAAGALAGLARGNSDIQAVVLRAGVSSELLKGQRP